MILIYQIQANPQISSPQTTEVGSMNFQKSASCTSRKPSKLTISIPLIQAHISATLATSDSFNLLSRQALAYLAFSKVLLISLSTSTSCWCCSLISTAESVAFLGLFTIAIYTNFEDTPELSIFQRQRRPASSCNLKPVCVRNSLVRMAFLGLVPILSSSMTNLTFWDKSNQGNESWELLLSQWTVTSTLRNQLTCGFWIKCWDVPDTLKGSRWYWLSPSPEEAR